MTRYEIDKAVEDGETQVCLNTKNVGCRKELTVDNFNKRQRERKNSLYWSFERLCKACQSIQAKVLRIAAKEKELRAAGKVEAPVCGNNKKSPIDHCGWLAIDNKFFIDLQPPVIDRVKRYVL
jgi:5-methylcytosine-specific restriction endonuclease McrA